METIPRCHPGPDPGSITTVLKAKWPIAERPHGSPGCAGMTTEGAAMATQRRDGGFIPALALRPAPFRERIGEIGPGGKVIALDLRHQAGV